uniref:Uncharacterized protein n=1 Tax=Cajanus cajan TaxID=3821 RepID=A0A151R736_CAJCA|nr:hypothetical protein KK1_040326 [Cajanus cajan]
MLDEFPNTLNEKEAVKRAAIGSEIGAIVWRGEKEKRKEGRENKKSEGRSRVDRDADNLQLQQLEEKDVVSSVATVLSDLCGPGEWMPMEKLHAEVLCLIMLALNLFNSGFKPLVRYHDDPPWILIKEAPRTCQNWNPQYPDQLSDNRVRTDIKDIEKNLILFTEQ